MIRALISFTALALALGSTVQAQTAASAPAGAYPSKPIRLIVPFPPGGGTDIVGRWLGQVLAQELKATVIPMASSAFIAASTWVNATAPWWAASPADASRPRASEPPLGSAPSAV